MDKSFKTFLKLGIDLTCVGIEMRADEAAYFCTPKGASVIGWAGVDGIHYCRIRGFGNMVFAVSPMNDAPDYVHPIAEDFETLLRLLLACGDAAALEQAWQWNEEQFNLFLKEYPPTEEMKEVLLGISAGMRLSPMENPWQYIHHLQENFDYSKIKYTEDIVDPDMNINAKVSAPEWKVYFDGSFWGHHGKAHAGREICIKKQFEWAGRTWLIPAAYSCSKGLVVDFCMRVEADEIRSFMNKWSGIWENDSCERQMEMNLENPLLLDFVSCLELNGQKMSFSHGCGVAYKPCTEDGADLDAKWVVEHYGLDAACGWVISRYAFPWKCKRRPDVKTLSLTMEQRPEQIPGPHFKTHSPGDSFSFVHPVSQIEYTLTVRELEKQTLPKNSFPADSRYYPTHFTAMSYTISPETPEAITISDCEGSDKPIEIKPPGDSFLPSASNDAFCIGIIGGADGPTVIGFGEGKQGKLRTACSALHFEPVDHDIEWRITFHEKRFEDFSVILI